MKTILFENQETWGSLEKAEFETWLTEQLATLKLDAAEFAADLKDQALTDKIQDSFNKGYQGGVTGTPFVVINGSQYQGNLDAQSMLDYVEYSKVKYKECPPTVIDTDKKYTATLKTEKGDIVVELFAKQAPLTVNSFVFLSRGLV